MSAAPLAALLAALLVAGCGADGDGDAGHGTVPPPPPPPPPPGAGEVPAPDLTDMEPRVRIILMDARRRVLEDLANPAEWGRYAMILDAHEVHAPAIEAYRVARRLGPGDFRWAYLLAHVLRLQESEEIDPGVVEEAFRAAAALNPDYAPLQVRLGEILLERGAAEGARAAFSRAIELDPAISPAHCGLTRALAALGKTGEALRRIERAASGHPESWEIQMTLARAYARAGDRERARRAADRARELPQTSDFQDLIVAQMRSYAVSAKACFKRARALAAAGDYRKAILNLNVVAEVRPEFPPVHERLGWCYLSTGRNDLAIRHFERALRLDPELPQAHLGLGQALEAAGRTDEANEHLEIGRGLRARTGSGR